MFENKLDKNNSIHYSRYIMSWIRMGGNCKDKNGFLRWLGSIHVDSEDARDIELMMSNGKMELERSARGFLRS